MRVYIIDKEEYRVGRYKITLLIDQEHRIVGALVEAPRRSKPIYIAYNEDSKIRLPKEVIKFLASKGFKVKRA